MSESTITPPGAPSPSTRTAGTDLGPAGPARVAVVGLDGVPYSLLTRLIAAGEMPNMARLAGEGDLAPLRSVVPTVSSVAWTSFLTGVNPGGHGLFGFIDRTLSPLRAFIPDSRSVRSETLFDLLGRHGRRVVVLGVPGTYPPRQVNGILVGCFLGTELERIAWPVEVGGTLARLGYIIDVDPWLGRKPDKGELLEQLRLALDRRFATAFHFLASEPWDYFHLHVMDTDRLMHFLWGPWEEGDPLGREGFLDFFRRVDGYLGVFVDQLPPRTELVLLSDHGFCRLRYEVQVNEWLRQAGYLRWREGAGRGLERLDPASRAYSMIPGRIFLNLRGREPEGVVEPGEEAAALRREIASRMAGELRDPGSGEPILERVAAREEIYRGPFLEEAADLIAIPRDGYDLKGKLGPSPLFERTELSGMHTFGDAFLYLHGRQITRREGISLLDLFPTIAGGLFGLPLEEGQVEGMSVL